MFYLHFLAAANPPVNRKQIQTNQQEYYYRPLAGERKYNPPPNACLSQTQDKDVAHTRNEPYRAGKMN
jgi:hypothetical protein